MFLNEFKATTYIISYIQKNRSTKASIFLTITLYRKSSVYSLFGTLNK